VAPQRVLRQLLHAEPCGAVHLRACRDAALSSRASWRVSLRTTSPLFDLAGNELYRSPPSPTRVVAMRRMVRTGSYRPEPSVQSIEIPDGKAGRAVERLARRGRRLG
jgi:hypothetical protein